MVEVGAHRRHKNQQQQLVNYWRIFICAITGDSLFPVYRLVIFFMVKISSSSSSYVKLQMPGTIFMREHVRHVVGVFLL